MIHERNWAAEEFGGVKMGDARLIKLADRLRYAEGIGIDEDFSVRPL